MPANVTSHAVTNAAPVHAQPIPTPSGPDVNVLPVLPPNRVAGLSPAPNQGWQCLNALLFVGPKVVPFDNVMVACPIIDVGPYSSAVAPPTQILTTSYAASLRERLLHRKLLPQPTPATSARMHDMVPTKSVPTSGNLQLFQRQTRARLVDTYQEKIMGMSSLTLCMLPEQLQSMLCSRRAHMRSKRQSTKDVKQYYKEDRRRRLEWKDKLRRKQQDLFKALAEHRERFLSYHRFIRNTGRSLAIAVMDNHGIFTSKTRFGTDTLAEKRMLALKSHDMDSYVALIKDTKNDRLKFLLNETDSCVTTINKLVAKQMGGGEGHKDSTKSSDVVQPSIMRGGDLKEYQLEGLKWLISLHENNLNGILADDMGLGKTIQTIAMLSYLMEFKRNNGPFLIVVPLSTLSNWANEISKWAPTMIRVVYKGAPNLRKQIVKDVIDTRQFNVLLTTYEYIMKDTKALKRVEWQYIIVDEGHRMKNAESKFAQTLGNIYTSKHRLLLTGTPLQNNLPELWALLNFLLPTVFNSMESFDQWFNKPFAQFRQQGVLDENDTQNVLSQEERLLIVHRLHEVLRPFMLRRVKDQVLDQLPEKREIVLRCHLSGWQRKLYKAIYSRSMSGIKELQTDGTVATQGLNNPIMHMRKVCNHPYLFLTDWNIDEDLVRTSGKFELMDRMLPKLAAAGHRVLLFTQMTQLMTIMERFLEMRGMKYLRLDGSTSSDEREKRMYMFNDPDSPYFIFLLSTRAGGLGLNLATADTVIIFDSDWNPMMDAQAQDRAHRIGQKNEVRVFRLVAASSIEDKILARATDKKNLNGLVVEAGLVGAQADRNGAEDYSVNAKEMMESLLSEWSAGGTEMAVDEEEEDDVFIADDDQINDMMATYDGELELYTAMDKRRAEARAHAWNEYNRTLGLVGSACLPQRSPLMGKDEQPPWLTADSWASRSSGIIQAMLGTLGGTRSSLSGAVVTMAQNSDANGIKFDPNDGFGYDAFGNKLSGPQQVIGSTLIGGKAMRQRKEVSYDDGLTEGQFQRMLEKQADDMEDSRKKAKRAREEHANAEMDVEINEPAKAIRERVLKEVESLFHAILRLKRASGAPLCEWFKEKPSKHIFRDYYTLIQNPISLKEMQARLKRGGYECLEAIEEDFALMSRNARTYNLDGSEVFKVCEDIRAAFYEGMNVIRSKFALPERVMPMLSHGIVQIYNEKELENASRLLDRQMTSDEMEMAPLKLGLNKKRI